jgi:hypothetical protein
MSRDTYAAERAIERVVLTVARRSDEGKIDAVVDLFADDAVLDVGTRRCAADRSSSTSPGPVARAILIASEASM